MAQPSRTRPPQQITRNVYDHLFHSGSSLSKLRDAIAAGRLLQSSDGGIGVPGRSLAWKLFLLKNVPLEPPPHEMPVPPLDALRAHRKQYSELLLEKMRAPDGSYDETFVVPGLTIPRRNTKPPTDLETNNPLSLHDENPWREWFAAVDLRKTIQQDVERTFPDIGYFRDEDVQQQLTNILFLYAVMHPDIEYRQGMHELLAPVYYAVDYDSTVDDATSPSHESVFREVCSRAWIAADSWALFCAIMDGISQWYEWREPSSVETSSARGQVNFKPYVSPITVASNHIQNSLLKSVDPILYGALQSSGIEPQIYGLRWLRLLFTREISMDDAMILWDGLFASPIAISELAQWICVAMLIRIRTKLISSDYSMQLTYLLRYPPCSQVEDGAPHHAILLLRQASLLEISRTPSSGAIVMTENRNLLNIPLEVPDPPVQMRRRTRPPGHQMSSSDFHGTSSGQGEHMRQSPSFQMGLPELIARGLMDRGESLGINKTVMNAVSELRRNLPELAASLVRTPSMASAPYAAYPLLDEHVTDDRHVSEHESRVEAERAATELRGQNKRLGESITWILSVLQSKESAEATNKDSERISMQQKEALGSLTYIRDILGGEVKEIDERRLWGVEEYNRRLEGQSEQESREPSASQPRQRSMTTSPILSVTPNTNEHPPPPVQREVRHFSPNTPAVGILRTTTSAPLNSSSMALRISTAPLIHNRSQSSTALFPTKPITMQRTPLRLSSNNPFQRTPETGGIPPAAVASDQTPKVRSEVQHDPLGVLK
ncbi:rab-GTPase-TBC domain-containing protein [Suillus paluster]|uniref:rab-GTPase-TBC domain-containing protein n=1 Tax=Suillus paluster TaxID=48578 RepID=UPI001B85E0A2|nr:rab-GTPase-TBC domain-containing protein [Suillus paluster]KAG1756495.1 rab-GTPase-TBC domain-containing protein [Suillus paluster]